VFKKLTLAVAAGAGYVLGAKAGKERYAQIESKFREIAGMPAVQNATATVKETASGVADTAKSQVNEKVEKASAKGKGAGDKDVVVDLGTGANTGATMAGAAASGSAPGGGTTVKPS
jgi:CO dehydrogenase/acetyl-CoA synthase epsilon subunit